MDINRRGFLFLAAGGLLLLNGCGRKAARSALPRGSRVLALGDSLTAGFGASAGGDYPRQHRPHPANPSDGLRTRRFGGGTAFHHRRAGR